MLRNELTKLTQQQMSLQSRIMLIKVNTRTLMSSLKNVPLTERLVNQQIAMSSSNATELQISEINKQIDKIKKLKETKKIEVMEARKARKGLEQLREKELEQFNIETSKIEQEEVDEVSIMASARLIIHQQAYLSS